METVDIILSRKSTRSYKEEQISKEDLDLILKAGYQAPVASGDYASLHITVIQNKDTLNKIGEYTSTVVEKMIGKKLNMNFCAPTMIVISSKLGIPKEYNSLLCLSLGYAKDEKDPKDHSITTNYVK